MLFMPGTKDYPELTPEEKALPVSRYYYRPLTPLNPVYQRAMHARPYTLDRIPDPCGWWKLVRADGYNDSDFGYGMMENGAGYLAVYTRSSQTPEMTDWWFGWMGVHPKSMPEGQGNIRYKIWCPPDHFECCHEKNFGTESLDLGQGDPKEMIMNYSLDPVEAGMPREVYEELTSKGVTIRIGYEKFDHPGTHLTFGYMRPCPTGGYEEIRREWLGYQVKDGKIVRDEETPCDEQYLRKIVIHNCIEHIRLQAFLPELYAEYKDKPIDAD